VSTIFVIFYILTIDFLDFDIKKSHHDFNANQDKLSSQYAVRMTLRSLPTLKRNKQSDSSPWLSARGRFLINICAPGPNPTASDFTTTTLVL
jgi:hypothetical protein